MTLFWPLACGCSCQTFRPSFFVRLNHYCNGTHLACATYEAVCVAMPWLPSAMAVAIALGLKVDARTVSVGRARLRLCCRTTVGLRLGLAAGLRPLPREVIGSSGGCYHQETKKHLWIRRGSSVAQQQLAV